MTSSLGSPVVLGAVSAVLASVVGYVAKDWLVFLIIAWLFLLMGGVALFRNHRYRAVALGGLLGLSVTVGYLVWKHEYQTAGVQPVAAADGHAFGVPPLTALRAVRRG